ncbi:MAG: hypothetical protein Ct9H90mP15_00780 [Candidatus Neomarinimicrobiota bacterium]|nr:MAG: hypothetical protein Ct9H90mP15_00780 [Candidatus Neomarinimicrobiota bacterium]
MERFNIKIKFFHAIPIYFFGDNHFQLSSSEKEDKKIEKFSQFLNMITNNNNQGTLFIMGDLFDYYFEYKNRTPEYHQKIFAFLLILKIKDLIFILLLEIMTIGLENISKAM